MNLKAKAI